MKDVFCVKSKIVFNHRRAGCIV